MNIQGKNEDLKLFNEEGTMVYHYTKLSDSYWCEFTYDSNGDQLTYKNSDGYSSEFTYDSNGNEVSFKNSEGFWFEYTFDSNGKELTYKNSDGVTRGF